MDCEERAAEVERIRKATPSDDRAIWQERQFLLAELDRVTVERDEVISRTSYHLREERDAALAQVKALEDVCGKAVVEAAVVVETLWICHQAIPFTELAPELIQQLPVAVGALRDAATALGRMDSKRQAALDRLATMADPDGPSVILAPDGEPKR